MALPWKTILTNVPWRDVIGKAPNILDSAKVLWSMGRKNGDGASPDGETVAPADADIVTRVNALEIAQRKSRTQMLASGELIQALSEQNAQLVAQIDSLRRRTRLMAWVLATTTIIACLALYLTWHPRISEFFA
jgi:hypothetical protein